MATYKVIQDIEAEDHILGPLSLRQFIFAILAVLCFYFTYLVISKGVGFIAVIFLPPGLFMAFFAFPFGKDQPTEVWALAKLRFLFKPRKRIWDQSGVKELVTVTAPKRIEERRTDGLSPIEVRSRLNALASTIDSRGWAIKNVNVNLFGQPTIAPTDASDRLVAASSLPQEVPNYDVQASDDIMDTQNNPIAQQFDQMINASAQSHRDQLVGMMNQVGPAVAPTGPTTPISPTPAPASGSTAAAPADYWFLNQPVEPPKLANDQAVFASAPLVTPGTDEPAASVVPHAADPTAAEEALLERLKAQQGLPEPTYAHMKTILPLDQQQKVQPQAPVSPLPPLPVIPNPAVQKLANNNDLNVATIAREAERTNNPSGKLGDDEVIVSLH